MRERTRIRDGGTFLFLMMATHPAFAIELAGPILESATWTEAMNPVEIVDSATVAAGVRIVILPRTIVRFAPGVVLGVQGEIEATGAPGFPVVFELAGGESGSDAVIRIEGRGSIGGFVHCSGSGVSIQGRDRAVVGVHHSEFTHVDESIRLERTQEATILGTRFDRVGVAVRSVDAAPQIEGCRFTEVSQRAVHLSGQGTEFAPPAALKIRGPKRTVAGKTLTLRVEVLDSEGGLYWPMWKGFGSVQAHRADNGAPVAISEEEIEFTNGVGCITLSLAELGEIDIAISVEGVLGVHRVLSFDLAENRTFALGVLPPGDQIWRPEGGVYHLTGRVLVWPGTRLILEAGTLLMLDLNVEIEVYGKIEIRGTEENPVHFFPTQTNRPWAQLRIRNTSDFIQVNHAYFTGGADGPKETGEEHTFDGPMLRFRPHDDVTQLKGASIEGCLFSDARGKGIFSHNGERYEVRDCLFSRLDFGLEMHGKEIRIEDCQVVQMNKGGPNQDGMYLWRPTNRHTIDRCIVAETGDDGIDAFESALEVRNSLIHGVADKNITFFFTDGWVDNCLIFGGGYGCFVREEPGANRFEARRSTIFDHSVYGVRVENLVAMDIAECILAENTVPFFHFGVNPSVNHCAFDSLPFGLSGTGNREVDPDFIDPAAHDFRLNPGSPLQTAGPNGGPIGWQGFPSPGQFPPLLKPSIKNCRFLGGGTAVEIEGGCDLETSGNLIDDFGVGIRVSAGSYLLADRSTLVGCDLALLLSDSRIDLKSCILWDNASQLEKTQSTAAFEYSTVGPTPPPGFQGPGNFSEDPAFLDPGRRDYRLRANSSSAGSGLGGVDRGALPALSGDERSMLLLH